MNLRWLFGNFTDRQYRMSVRDQMRLSNRAHEGFVSGRAFMRWTVLVVLPPFVVAFVLLTPVLGWLGYGGDSLAWTIASIVLLFLFWIWSAWMYRYLYIKPIRRAMREAGVMRRLRQSSEID